jgi:hypothetical protein
LGKGVSRGDAEGTEINVLDYIEGVKRLCGYGINKIFKINR